MRRPGRSTDPYSYTGLYAAIASLAQPSDAVKTDTGTAFTTLGTLLNDATVEQTSGTVTGYAWEYAKTNATQSLASASGKASVTLTATP